MDTTLLQSVLRYTQSLKSYVDSRIGKIAVSETTTIEAQSQISYDLTSSGSDAGMYDYLSSVITVKVQDPEPTSPTYGLYINSEAMVSYGCNADGNVVIFNHYDQDLVCYVRIDVPLANL